MAVKVNFFSVIIPIKNIEKCKNIGGLNGLLSLHKNILGKITWYDKYLYKDAAMNYDDVEDILSFWKNQGLTLIKKNKKGEYWNDLAVVHAINGPTLPCPWLIFKSDKKTGESYVYFKNHPIGKIIKESPK